MKKVILGMLMGLCATSISATSALALTEFKSEFKKKYIDTHKDEAFKALAKKQSCKVCHVDKKPKKIENLNEYGMQLSKIIEGDANQRKKDARKKGGTEAANAEKAKLIKEVQKAFDTIAKKKSEAGDTFGDRIKNGLLPSSTDTPKKDAKDADKDKKDTDKKDTDKKDTDKKDTDKK